MGMCCHARLNQGLKHACTLPAELLSQACHMALVHFQLLWIQQARWVIKTEIYSARGLEGQTAEEHRAAICSTSGKGLLVCQLSRGCHMAQLGTSLPLLRELQMPPCSSPIPITPSRDTSKCHSHVNFRVRFPTHGDIQAQHTVVGIPPRASKAKPDLEYQSRVFITSFYLQVPLPETSYYNLTQRVWIIVVQIKYSLKSLIFILK